MQWQCQISFTHQKEPSTESCLRQYKFVYPALGFLFLLVETTILYTQRHRSPTALKPWCLTSNILNYVTYEDHFSRLKEIHNQMNFTRTKRIECFNLHVYRIQRHIQSLDINGGKVITAQSYYIMVILLAKLIFIVLFLTLYIFL